MHLWTVNPDTLITSKLFVVTSPATILEVFGWEFAQIAAAAEPIDIHKAALDPEADTGGFDAVFRVGHDRVHYDFWTEYMVRTNDSFGDIPTRLQVCVPARLMLEVRAADAAAINLTGLTGLATVWTDSRSAVDVSGCPRAWVDVHDELIGLDATDPDVPHTYFQPVRKPRRPRSITPAASFPLSQGRLQLMERPQADENGVLRVRLSAASTWTSNAVLEPEVEIYRGETLAQPIYPLNQTGDLRTLEPPGPPVGREGGLGPSL